MVSFAIQFIFNIFFIYSIVVPIMMLLFSMEMDAPLL